MGDGTAIEWTDATWNFLRGCRRKSAGCMNCYAEAIAHRFSGEGLPYEGLAKDGRWTGAIMVVESRLDQPIRWRRPRRIFVNSMSDVFYEEVPTDVVDQMFAVMALADWHTFQVLTKRAERMFEYLSDPATPERVAALARAGIGGRKLFGELRWPLANVHVGVTVEDQDAADERIPWLVRTPAAIRFLSCEPPGRGRGGWSMTGETLFRLLQALPPLDRARPLEIRLEGTSLDRDTFTCCTVAPADEEDVALSRDPESTRDALVLRVHA